MSEIITFILHCNEYIGQFINSYGNFIYMILFAIIFCETGLVFLPFLPGDSLIFAAGTFAAIGEMNLALLLIILSIAAILGDTVNYEIGKHFGKKILNSPKIKFLNPEHIKQAQEFIHKHGGKAVFLARFVPIIRTIVPFLVGMGELQYRKFIKFNLLGGLVWVFSFTLLGYFFGSVPFVVENFSLLIIVIIAVSVIPMIIALVKSRKGKKRKISSISKN